MYIHTWLVICCLLTLLLLTPYILTFIIVYLQYLWVSKNNNLTYCCVQSMSLLTSEFMLLLPKPPPSPCPPYPVFVGVDGQTEEGPR